LNPGDPSSAVGGAQLLALLQAAARCGVPIVQSCMQRLLWHCNQVLFKQLTSWCACVCVFKCVFVCGCMYVCVHCEVLNATPAVALQPSAIQAAYIMVRLCVLL